MALSKQNLRKIGIAILIAIFACTVLCAGLVIGSSNKMQSKFVSAAEGVWTDYATAPSNTTAGDSRDNPIRIGTSSELAWLAQEVNAGNDFSGRYIELNGTLDLSAHNWVPIGTADNPFNTLSSFIQNVAGVWLFGLTSSKKLSLQEEKSNGAVANTMIYFFKPVFITCCFRN